MNTNVLKRHYDTLTPLERLPLILDAFKRSDEVEWQRLVQSAPRIRFESPAHYFLGKTLTDLAWMYHSIQLELVATYWKATALPHVDVSLDYSDTKTEELVGKAIDGLRNQISWRREAWERFALEMHFDPDVLLKDLPGYELVKEVETLFRQQNKFFEEQGWNTLEATPEKEAFIRSLVDDFNEILNHDDEDID